MSLTAPGWLTASELRIGLGCMRTSTDENRDEELALVEHILGKLGVHSRAQAVGLAYREGLLEPQRVGSGDHALRSA